MRRCERPLDETDILLEAAAYVALNLQSCLSSLDVEENSLLCELVGVHPTHKLT